VKILAFNCGSSTLKFQLTALADENVVFGKERRLAYGTVDRIGTQGRIQFTIPNKEDHSQSVTVADHGEVTRSVLDWLRDTGLLDRDGGYSSS
jgi:acetate kinase